MFLITNKNTFWYTDAYTTNDIVYVWIPGEVRVGNKEMAQFEYKGSKLTSDIEDFDTGWHQFTFVS